jgi:hypothetical protein
MSRKTVSKDSKDSPASSPDHHRADTKVRAGTRLMVPIADLRPTQITVGLHHVRSKMHVTRAHRCRLGFLEKHTIPIVIGPGAVWYAIDHHHWLRCWYELEIAQVPVVVKHDFSRLSKKRFWQEMTERHLVHPYNERGKRIGVASLPANAGEMRDDPYRSLESFVQLSGAYDKVKRAYPDFRWADYFRRHIVGPMDTAELFALAMAHAVKLARSAKAQHLPGFKGEKKRRGPPKEPPV